MMPGDVLALPLSAGLVKMEERKRPATTDHDDVAPPLKRQVTTATSTNGSVKAHADSDVPGRDELEKFQKEAILRQMQEYKREKQSLESRLHDLNKRATHHDDHLRTIDAWFNQLLDQVRLSLGQVSDLPHYLPFPSSILSADGDTFGEHLRTRAENVTSAIEQIFSKPSTPASEVAELQKRLSQALADEKRHVNDLERTRLEKEQVEERLETASMRYMMAEKKLDRAKSLTVAKLERQAVAGNRTEAATGTGASADTASTKPDTSTVEVDNEAFLDAERKRKEALAVSAKQAEQISQLAADNERLLDQTTSLNVRLVQLSEDDFAQSDLFKQLKCQYEDMVTKINGVEALNADLRKEIQKLKEARSAYRVQLESEFQVAISEKDSLLAKAESDLARIRTTRDELAADVQMRKATTDVERTTPTQARAMLSAKDDRISALESEVQRLQSSNLDATIEGLDALPVEELRTKHGTLQKQYTLLIEELSSMGAAYKKLSGAASQKFANASDLEEKVLRLTAEKAKAEQKYFAAMKNKDAREQEIRALRTQNSKSSEIVSQLKDAEASTNSMMSLLEKQLAESRALIASLEDKHLAFQTQVRERSLAVEGLQSQLRDLKATLSTKDAALSATAAAERKCQLEVEQLRTELADKDKRLETFESKGTSQNQEHVEMLRKMCICTVCRKNFKNTVIKVCGHLFCRDCIDERLQSRMRKCPNCNKGFGANDHMRVTL